MAGGNVCVAPLIAMVAERRGRSWRTTAAKYSDWTGSYGDVDVLAALAGPAAMEPSTTPLAGRFSPSWNEARERTDTSPVDATSTLDALAGDPLQLQACARRIATDLLADLGHAETTLLKLGGQILSARLEQRARENIETWMRAVGLHVHD